MQRQTGSFGGRGACACLSMQVFDEVFQDVTLPPGSNNRCLAMPDSFGRATKGISWNDNQRWQGTSKTALGCLLRSWRAGLSSSTSHFAQRDGREPGQDPCALTSKPVTRMLESQPVSSNGSWISALAFAIRFVLIFVWEGASNSRLIDSFV